jgi:hypothetical protein
MLRHRIVLLVLCVLLVTGSFSGTLAYVLHLRSDAYRESAEKRLSALLNMPVDIGRIHPLSFSSSRFEHIRTWLPGRSLQVFACDQALWRQTGREADATYALDLQDGWLLVGTGSWGRSEYDAILASGLGHDFASLRLREIHLDDLDFRWDHPSFQLSARAAGGVILLDDDGIGTASLHSRQLNDHASSEPIHIHARFVPGAGLRFEEVVLDVPRIPLSALGLNTLLRGPVTEGTFAGRVTYRETDAQRLSLTGSVWDGRLDELTRQVIGGPFRGRMDVTLDEASFVGRRLGALRFHGRLVEVCLHDLLPALRDHGGTGRLQLDVAQCEYVDGRIRRFSASGEAEGLPLQAVTDLLGFGRVTGTVDLRIHSLLVDHDRLRAADIDLIAAPPADRPGTIDKEVIRRALQQLVGIDAAPVLPDQVEYTQLGVKLLLSGEQLTVRGTHGPDGRTILTVKLAGREWGLLKQPDRAFAVGDLLALARHRVEQYGFDDIETWWTRQHEP